MRENNIEKPAEFKPMPLEEYREIIERLEDGEEISEVFAGDQDIDDESRLSTLFGNGLMQYKPTEEEKEELKELTERAVKITNKIRKNRTEESKGVEEK